MTPEAKAYVESEDFIAGFECLKHEVPWIVPEAVFQLEDLLTKEDLVMEVGTGGSTIFFAKHCGHVTAIETDESWGVKLMKYMIKRDITNISYNVIADENIILDLLRNSETDGITVFSVDTQGGEYNRSKILDAFLSKGVSSKLRVIVLDNYGHEGLFPDHHDRVMALGYGWKRFEFNHPRWAGNGTCIYLKIK